MHGGTKEWRVLSFTNNAADVITDRVSRFANSVAFPHYIGTFDGWLHGYLVNPYGYLVTAYAGKNEDRSIRMISEDSQAGFLSQFETAYPFANCGKIKANQYYHTEQGENVWFNSGSANRAIDAARQKLPNELDSWRKKELLNELKKLKKKFWAAGFAVHADVESICLDLLSKSDDVLTKFAKRFTHIIVDECQDLSPGQLQILELLRSRGSLVRLIGDLNQAIYSFRKVSTKKIIEFIEKNNLNSNNALTKNFRSIQPIVDVCSQLIDHGKIEGLFDEFRVPSCIYVTYDAGALSLLPSQMEALISARGLNIEKSAILSRGNSTLRKLNAIQNDIPDSPTERIATAIYLWKRSDVLVRADAINWLGRVITKWFFSGQPSDRRDNDRPESVSSGIWWRLFLARVLDGCARHEGLSMFDQPWEKWAKIGRIEFGRIVTQAWRGREPISTLDVQIRSPQGKGKDNVRLSLATDKDRSQTGIRITSIHKIKGQTLDAVVIVSAPDKRGDGGHWRHWLDQTSDDGEHARFGYVASSRPRYLLIWAIPKGKPKDDDQATLARYGFTAAEDV